MTNAELFETIDNYLMGLHRIDVYAPYDEYSKGWNDALEAATKVISTLESEKPMQEGLEEEIHEYNKERFDEYFPEQDGDFISEVDFMTCLDRVARHFAQWGAEHLKK